MITTLIIYFSFLGATIASFLGVIIDRFPRKESFVTGRSHCDNCNRDLSYLEMIPIASFIIQKGRCKFCKVRLPNRYLILEVLGATCFSVSMLRFGFDQKLIISLILACILIIVAYIDIDTMIINNRFNAMIACLGVISILLSKQTFQEALIGALSISVPLAFLSITTGAVGFGDVKLMFASGILLGFRQSVVAFIIAVLIGGIYGSYLLLTKRVNRKTAIPFGPFLCIGIFIAYLYGSDIFHWYINLII